MNYTNSPGYATHPGTGQRMHDEAQPLPTVWGEADANMLIWSCMEIVKAAGVTPAAFDADTPSTYQRLLQAVRAMGGPVGEVCVGYWATAPRGYLEAAGQTVSRSSYPALWAHAQTLGPATDAAWLAAGPEGRTVFADGDGSTTFRLPDLRGMFVRGWDHGRGLDAGRALASHQDSANRLHGHPFRTATGNANTDGGGGIAMEVDGTVEEQPPYTGAPGVVSQAPSTLIGGDGEVEARPRNVALLVAIKF